MHTAQHSRIVANVFRKFASSPRNIINNQISALKGVEFSAPNPIVLAKSLELTLVLYMSFDRFLLVVESRDLSQADKSIIRLSSFSILQNFNFSILKILQAQ